VVHERVEYLEAPLDRATLTRLAEQLVDPVAALVRVDDPAFTVLGLDPADYVTAPAVIDLLVAHPEVMQRPVVVSGGRAVIARPPDRVGELIGRMPPD
jgi:arsenate reductase